MDVRIAPAVGPYSEGVSEDFAKIMPPGMEPIGLFRVLAKNPRVLRRVRRASLLDAGSISVRQREIIILRTTALNRAEYEWGVHVAFFARAAGLDMQAQYATVHLDASAPYWATDEALLVRACDELHVTGTLSDALFAELRGHFQEDQVLELLALAGFYRMISCVVRATGLALESQAARFPALD